MRIREVQENQSSSKCLSLIHNLYENFFESVENLSAGTILIIRNNLIIRIASRNKFRIKNRCMGTRNKSTCSERVCSNVPNLGHLQPMLPLAT